MLDIFKKKTFWIGLIVVAVLMAFMGSLQVGLRQNTKAKQLPVALVDLNKTDASKKVTKQLKDKFDDKDAILKLKEVSSTKKMNNGLDEQKYYGAIVIDKNFDKKMATYPAYIKANIMASMPNAPQQAAPKAPSKPEITFIVNEGMNSTVSTLLNTAFDKMGSGINQKLGTSFIAALDKANAKIDSTTYANLSSPLNVEIKKVHKVKKNTASGMLPLGQLILTWLGTMVGSLAIWFAVRKNKKTIGVLVSQIIAAVVLSAAVASFGILVDQFYNINIENTGTFWMTLFIISIFFTTLQAVLLDYFKLFGQVLLVIIFLLSLTSMMYAPEMLPTGFREWIFNFLPVRPAFNALTNIVYFDTDTSVFKDAIKTMNIGSLISTGLILASTFLPKSKQDKLVDAEIEAEK